MADSIKNNQNTQLSASEIYQNPNNQLSGSEIHQNPIVFVPPTKDAQEADVKKAAPSFCPWKDSSIAQMISDPSLELLKGNSPSSTISAEQKKAISANIQQILADNDRKPDFVEAPKAAEETLFSRISVSVSDFFGWITGIVTGKKEVSDEMTEEDRAQLRGTIALMGALLAQIKEIQEANADEIKLEEHQRLVISAKEDEAVLQKDRMIDYRKKKMALEKKRFAKMEETLELAKKEKFGKKMGEMATSVQLFAAAIGVSSGVGAAILMTIAVGNAVDTMFDDKGKAWLASTFTSDKEYEETLVQRMEIGIGVLGAVVSVGGILAGVSSNVKASLDVGLNALKGASAINETQLTYRSNSLKGIMLDFKMKIEENQDKFRAALKATKGLNEIIHTNYRQLQQSMDNRHETIIAGFRQ